MVVYRSFCSVCSLAYSRCQVVGMVTDVRPSVRPFVSILVGGRGRYGHNSPGTERQSHRSWLKVTVSTYGRGNAVRRSV